MAAMSNSINRRGFLGRSLVGLGALAAAPTLLAQIPQKVTAAVSGGDLLFCNSGFYIGDVVFMDRKGAVAPIADIATGDYVLQVGIVTGPSTIKLSIVPPAGLRQSVPREI